MSNAKNGNYFGNGKDLNHTEESSWATPLAVLVAWDFRSDRLQSCLNIQVIIASLLIEQTTLLLRIAAKSVSKHSTRLVWALRRLQQHLRETQAFKISNCLKLHNFHLKFPLKLRLNKRQGGSIAHRAPLFKTKLLPKKS